MLVEHLVLSEPSSRPEQAVEVTFTPEPEPDQPNGSKRPKRRQ